MILAILPASLKARGNNLAEGIAKVPGSGIQTFSQSPKVADPNGQIVLWASVVRPATILDDEAWVGSVPERDGIDANAANLLLSQAFTVTPDMLATDEEGQPLITPPALDRLILAHDMDTDSVLNWLKLTPVWEG
jgi:hypothetical protein